MSKLWTSSLPTSRLPKLPNIATNAMIMLSGSICQSDRRVHLNFVMWKAWERGLAVEWKKGTGIKLVMLGTRVKVYLRTLRLCSVLTAI